MRPADVFAGHLLFMAFRIATSALAFVILTVAIGAVPWRQALLLVPAVLLTGLAFAAPLAAWAITVTQFARINGVFRFVLMPLYMFSGTFYSTAQLPGLLNAVVECPPLYHGVQLCRELTLGTAAPLGTTVHIVYLTAMTTVGFLLGRRTYTRHLHS